MVGATQRPARRLIVTLIAASLTLAACGGDDTTSTTADADPTPTSESVTNTTEGSEPSATTTQPMTETTGATGTTEAAATAAIEVDPTALPADPSGFGTWSGDLCTLYSVEQLDSYFVGKGDLAMSEPLDGGCRWAVEGFPRSHYVDIVLVEDGTDAIYLVDGQIDTAGTQIDIAHGPEDIVAMIPTPEGTYLRVLIHGDFEAPSGPLGSYLDDAVAGLAENLVSRF